MKDDREDMRAKLLARREREGRRATEGFAEPPMYLPRSEWIDSLSLAFADAICPATGHFIVPSVLCDGVTDIGPMLEQWFREIGAKG